MSRWSRPRVSHFELCSRPMTCLHPDAARFNSAEPGEVNHGRQTGVHVSAERRPSKGSLRKGSATPPVVRLDNPLRQALQ